MFQRGETWKESVSCYITLLKWCVTGSKNHKCGWLNERIVEVQEDFLSVSWLWQVDGSALGFRSTGNKDGGSQQQECRNVWMDVFPWLFSLLCPTYFYAPCIVSSWPYWEIPSSIHGTGLYQKMIKCQCSDVKLEMDVHRKCLIKCKQSINVGDI